jgi:hypothetical protein
VSRESDLPSPLECTVRPRNHERNRKFADSPLEGDGFEPSVPVSLCPRREGAGLYEPSQDLARLVSSWQLGGEPDENIERPGAPGAPGEPGIGVAQVTPRSGLRWRLR